jgi:transcriptional regulator with XRE-family HTH domain
MAATAPRKRPLSPDDRRFARAVRTLRAELGLTVRELAERAGVDHAQIVRIEHADPDLARGATYATAVAIARVLGLSIDDLARLGARPVRRKPK